MKVKKFDGIWLLHGKNIRQFQLNKDGKFTIFLKTMKKGKECGLQKRVEFQLDQNISVKDVVVGYEQNYWFFDERLQKNSEDRNLLLDKRQSEDKEQVRDYSMLYTHGIEQDFFPANFQFYFMKDKFL